MWVTMRQMLERARPRQMAIGAFHAVNLEQIQGVLEAAVEERAPVIIAVDQPAAMDVGLGAFLALARELAQEVPVPASLLLSHVQDPDFAGLALEKGCPGIMADFRDLPLSELAGHWGRLMQKAHQARAFTEAAVNLPGPTGGIRDDRLSKLLEIGPDSICLILPPEDRERPAPGFIELLGRLADSTRILISLSGASAWAGDDIKDAIKSGCWKINAGTRLNMAFTTGLKSYILDNPDRINPRSYLGHARDLFRDEVRSLIRLFGSSAAA